MITFAIVNESKWVNSNDLSAMTGACHYQLQNHIAPAWNLQAPNLTFVSSRSRVPIGAIVVAVVDNPDVADAAGYHDLNDRGWPVAFVFVDPTLDHGGTILSGANSVSQTMSHELAEALVNPLIYGWADDERSGLIAMEIGDPVENDTYVVPYSNKEVSVSNFVLPSWFSIHGHAPFDYLHKLTRPRTMTRGGYKIIAKVSGEGQQFARDVEFTTPEEAATYPEWKTALKIDKGSRTYKYIK